MSTEIKITLDPQAERIVSGLQSLPMRVVNYIVAAMNQENLSTVSHIQKERLNGVGPFPVEEHRLGARSGRLWQSLWASPAEPTMNGQVDSSIGTNVKYAAIHEFGGRIHKPARLGKVRLRTDRRGVLVRQLGHSNLAIFAKDRHKQARTVDTVIPAHDVEMPERAPIRTGIADCAGNYRRTISQHILMAWTSMS